jgi:pimeloyl-ACP methyl ester carboxylesterase
VPKKYFYVEGVATFLQHAGGTTLPGAPPRTDRGRVVLCLHGAGGNSGQFADLLAALAQHHSPMAFDLPGHGRSGGLDSLVSIEQMATFTAALIEKLALPPPVVLGHSMGCAVALELALARPERLAGLVLAGGGAHVEGLDPVVEELTRTVAGKAPRRFAAETYAAEAPAELLQRGFAEEMKTDPRARLGAFRALSAYDARDRLGGIRMPTLAVVGDQELPHVSAAADLLAREIPGSRKLVVAGAGHMLPLEKPEDLAGAIEQFIGTLP